MPDNLLSRKVLFTGYYGYCNTGDDCFCVVAGWGAKKYWATDKIRFVSNSLPPMPVEADSSCIINQRLFGGQRLLEKLYWEATTPVMVYAGGSTFYRKAGGLRKLIKGVQYVRHTQLGAIGVSLGPFQSEQDRRDVQEYLKRFSFLALRDKRSYDEACSMKLPYEPVEAFDLAALLPDIYGSARNQVVSKRSIPVLGIALCNVKVRSGENSLQENERENRIFEVLMNISKTLKVKFRFFVFNGNCLSGDYGITEKFVHSLKELSDVEIFPYSHDPESVWHGIGQCDAFFSVRLHGGIMACFAGVPFMMAEYHQKCTDFLDDIGYPQNFRVGDMEKSSQDTAEMLIDILSSSDSFSFSVSPEFAEMAKRNFQCTIRPGV